MTLAFVSTCWSGRGIYLPSSSKRCPVRPRPSHYLSRRLPTCTQSPSNSNSDNGEEIPEEEKLAVQGPSQAPTVAGVSTAGLQGADARLLEASYAADVAAIKAALDDGASVDAYDVNGRTSLHFCAGNGLQTLVKDLVARGATLNRQDILGLTPLHMAAGYKMNTTVRALVDLGADANIASLDGKLPVEIAEDLLEKTPPKRFFLPNESYKRLEEIVELLDAATEVEEDEDEEPELSTQSLTNPKEDSITEEIVEDKKFIVRVREPKRVSSTPPPQPVVDEVKVTVRVKEASNSPSSADQSNGPVSSSSVAAEVAPSEAADVNFIVREPELTGAAPSTETPSTGTPQTPNGDDVEVTVRVKQPEKP